MTLDERGRSAGADLRDEVTRIAPPSPGAVLWRAARRRRLSAGFVGLALVASAGVGWRVLHDAAPVGRSLAVGDDRASGWSRILKAEAGLENLPYLNAVASDGDNAVLVGARTGGRWPSAAIWWSGDGRLWHAAEHPDARGGVLAVGVRDGVWIAIGARDDRDDALPVATSFVWRSEDRGRTWTEIASGRGLPAAADGQGRPWGTQVLFRNGWWVASGGSPTGAAGIWVSRTGEDWEQVLESRAGRTVLVELDDGRLMAYSGRTAWVTDDPTTWGPDQEVDLPGPVPASIASGADLAVGYSSVDHRDRHLLRSDDGGRTWSVDEDFDDRTGAAFGEDVPGEFLATAARFGDIEVVAGADDRNRPTAWISVDGGPWQTAPVALREPAGGELNLVSEIDDQIVVFCSVCVLAEVDRYYVFRP